MGCLCCCNDFLICRIRLSHYDIVTDCALLKPCLLKHHTIVVTKTLSCDFSDIMSAHLNCSTVYIVKPHKQIDNSRLSTACRAYDSHALSRLYVEIKILDKLFIRHIREINILYVHTSVCLIECYRIRSIRYFLFLLNQLENTSSTGKCVLKLCDDTRYLVERLGVLVGV